MGPPASHAALSVSRGRKGRHCVFCPPPQLHFSSLCLAKDTPETQLSHFKQVSGKWELAISNLFFSNQGAFCFASSPLVEKVLGSDKSLSRCGTEAQGDTKTDRDGPELPCSFVNSMTMKSKLSWHSFVVHCFYSPVLSEHRTTFDFTSVISQPQTAEI